MTRLSRRIDKLGGAGTTPRCVLVIQAVDETFDQALARWQAGHPGEDLDAPGTRLINVRLVPGPSAPSWSASRCAGDRDHSSHHSSSGGVLGKAAVKGLQDA